MPCWLVFCRQGFALLGLQLGLRVGSFHPWGVLWIWLLRILGGLLELTLLMLFSLEELEDFELVELEAAGRESDKTKTPPQLGFRELGLKCPNCRLHVGIQRSGVFVDSKRRRVDRGVFCPPDMAERQECWPNARKTGGLCCGNTHAFKKKKNKMDQVETTHSMHLPENEIFAPNFPKQVRKKTYTLQRYCSRKQTQQSLATRNHQACRKPNKHRREGRMGSARKHATCIAPQHNH